MSEAKRRIPLPDDPSAAVAAEGRSADPTGEGHGDHSEPPDSLGTQDLAQDEGFDLLADVKAERDAYLDGLQRLKAEFENFRRRADRDVREARARARVGLLTEFLPVLDNLERALNAAEHHEEGNVLEGVLLTHSMFADLLRKEGVTEVDPLGAAFDPHVHEALMTQPSDQEEGTVTAVFERGYVFGDTVLRPAKVVVSAGPAGE